MSNPDKPEVTRRGLFGELAGEAEEKVGELLHNDHLTVEGRLKQAIAETEGEGAEPVQGESAEHEESPPAE